MGSTRDIITGTQARSKRDARLAADERDGKGE